MTGKSFSLNWLRNRVKNIDLSQARRRPAKAKLGQAPATAANVALVGHPDATPAPTDATVGSTHARPLGTPHAPSNCNLASLA